MPINDIYQMAQAVTKSNFFGYKNPEEAMTLMLLANANGLHPVKAAERYHIIQGRPAMKADAMLAVFQESGGKIQWRKRTPEECVLWLAHPQGGELEVSWTIQRAKDAGLTTKSNWKQYPVQMLSARCVSEGVRALFPACLCGMYTPEEVQDFDVKPTLKSEDKKEKKVTKNDNIVEAEVVQEQPKASKKENFLAAMKKLEDACPDGYRARLDLMKIKDITLLPESDYRKVYNELKQHVESILAFEEQQKAQEAELIEDYSNDSNDLNDVQLFD